MRGDNFGGHPRHFEQTVRGCSDCKICYGYIPDCIITRNLKDYRLAALPIHSPEEFLEKLTEEHTDDE